VSKLDEIRQRNEAPSEFADPNAGGCEGWAAELLAQAKADIEYLLEEIDALRWIVMNPGAADSLRRGLDQLAARTVIQGVTDNHSAEPEPHAEGTF
jgi:hypothetical protein